MKQRKFWLGPLYLLLLWAIILGTPRLRNLAGYQFLSDDDVAKVGLWLAPLARFLPQRDELESIQFLAARYPDDPRVQHWATIGLGLERVQNLEPLLKRFPDEAWLYADYLVRLCMGFQTGRVPGTLAAPGPGVPPPPERPANLTKQQMQRALEICQHGAKLEPQNCFWDIMQALFLFGARRDDEALKILQNGSHKKYYDDHVTATARKRIEVHELRRPLLVEEKLPIWAATPLPHYGQIREVARLATWQAMQKQARGDWKNGLQIRAATARLGTRMRDQEGFYITTLVAYGVQSVTWRAGAPVPANRPPNSQAQFWVKHFAAQCRAHGQQKLAVEALREGAASAKLQAQWQQLQRTMAPTVLPGVSNRDWVLMLGLNWVGASLLMQLLVALPLWIFLAVLLWWKRVPGDERSLGAVFVVWFLVTLICFGVAALAVQQGGGWSQWAGFGLTGVAVPPNADLIIGSLRWLIALGPILLGALFCGVVGAWRQRHQWRALNQQRSESPLQRLALRRAVWLVLGALIFLISSLVILNLITNPAAPRFNFNNLLLDPVEGIIRFFTSPWLALNLMIFALAWWLFSSVWLAPRGGEGLVGENIKWYRQTLGATVICGSTLYLLLLFISLQVRRPAEAAFDSYLQRGEMALLKASLGTPSASKTR